MPLRRVLRCLYPYPSAAVHEADKNVSRKASWRKRVGPTILAENITHGRHFATEAGV